MAHSEYLECEPCGKREHAPDGGWRAGWYCVLQIYSSCSQKCAVACLKKHLGNPKYKLSADAIDRYQPGLYDNGCDGFVGEYTPELVASFGE